MILASNTPTHIIIDGDNTPTDWTATATPVIAIVSVGVALIGIISTTFWQWQISKAANIRFYEERTDYLQDLQRRSVVELNAAILMLHTASLTYLQWITTTHNNGVEPTNIETNERSAALDEYQVRATNAAINAQILATDSEMAKTILDIMDALNESLSVYQIKTKKELDDRLDDVVKHVDTIGDLTSKISGRAVELYRPPARNHASTRWRWRSSPHQSDAAQTPRTDPQHADANGSD